MAISINDTYEGDLLDYDGPKKIKMVNPEIALLTIFSSLYKIFRAKNEEIDFNFFLHIVSKGKCPKYYRYCY